MSGSLIESFSVSMKDVLHEKYLLNYKHGWISNKTIKWASVPRPNSPKFIVHKLVRISLINCKFAWEYAPLKLNICKNETGFIADVHIIWFRL